MLSCLLLTALGVIKQDEQQGLDVQGVFGWCLPSVI